MALIRLRGPLKDRAGGSAEHPTGAATVIDALRGLEGEFPDLAGWILDERGEIRRHINVYVNGERAHEQTPIGAEERVEILPAISGGAA